MIDTFSLGDKLLLSNGMRSKLKLITGRDAILAIGTQKHVIPYLNLLSDIHVIIRLWYESSFFLAFAVAPYSGWTRMRDILSIIALAGGLSYAAYRFYKA